MGSKGAFRKTELSRSQDLGLQYFERGRSGGRHEALEFVRPGSKNSTTHAVPE